MAPRTARMNQPHQLPVAPPSVARFRSWMHALNSREARPLVLPLAMLFTAYVVLGILQVIPFNLFSQDAWTQLKATTNAADKISEQETKRDSQDPLLTLYRLESKLDKLAMDGLETKIIVRALVEVQPPTAKAAAKARIDDGMEVLKLAREAAGNGNGRGRQR